MQQVLYYYLSAFGLSPAFVSACYFVLTALNSHGNPDVRNDLIELKTKRDLPVSLSLIIILANY